MYILSIKSLEEANAIWNTKLERVSEFDACGICEKDLYSDYDSLDDDEIDQVYWYNPLGKTVHPNCIKVIANCESFLNKKISSLFIDKSFSCLHQNDAHEKAVKAVMMACGSDSILSYQEKNGKESLTLLFNTVGVKAAEKYALKV